MGTVDKCAIVGSECELILLEPSNFHVEVRPLISYSNYHFVSLVAKKSPLLTCATSQDLYFKKGAFILFTLFQFNFYVHFMILFLTNLGLD